MTTSSGPVRQPRYTLDSLAREFLRSPFGAEASADSWLSRRLAEFLATRRLTRLASDRDAFDLLLNRVMECRDEGTGHDR